MQSRSPPTRRPRAASARLRRRAAIHGDDLFRFVAPVGGLNGAVDRNHPVNRILESADKLPCHHLGRLVVVAEDREGSFRLVNIFHFAQFDDAARLGDGAGGKKYKPA